MSRVFSIFFIMIVYILSAVMRGKKAAGKKKETPAPVNRAERSFIPKKRNDDDCDYGEVNHSYSHSNEKRVKQLDGYLKAGLIDKKEYREMLERYTRLDHQLDDY